MTITARGPTSIAAVVLAAGASRRFGEKNKLLVPWGRGDGAPSVLRHVVEMVQSVPIREIIVVTGNEDAAVRAALDGLGVTFAHNEAWALGMGHSIAAGVRAVSKDAEGVFIVPGDLPGLSAEVMRSLIAEFCSKPGAAVIVPVTAEGEQRNPVLWPSVHFERLARLEGDRGAKALLHAPDLVRADCPDFC